MPFDQAVVLDEVYFYQTGYAKYLVLVYLHRDIEYLLLLMVLEIFDQGGEVWQSYRLTTEVEVPLLLPQHLFYQQTFYPL